MQVDLASGCSSITTSEPIRASAATGKRRTSIRDSISLTREKLFSHDESDGQRA